MLKPNSSITPPTSKVAITSSLAGIGVSLGFFLAVLFWQIYQGKIYPGISILDISVAGLSQEEAVAKINATQPPVPYQDHTFSIVVDDIVVASTGAELGIKYDLDPAVSAAFQTGRSPVIINNVSTIISLPLISQNFTPRLTFDERKLTHFTTLLAQKVNSPHQEPEVVLNSSGVASTLEVNPGFIGRAVDANQLAQQLLAAINSVHSPADSLAAPVASVGAVLDHEQQQAALQRAARLVGTTLTFTTPQHRLQLHDQSLIDFLAFPEGYNQEKTDSQAQKWAELIDTEPQEPVFEHDTETKQVFEFIPPRDGLALGIESTSNRISTALAQSEDFLLSSSLQSTEDAAELITEYELPVQTTPPQTPLSSTNDLGINELIGFGDSEYDHSIPSRIHNVAITAEKTSNVLVAPGEQYSFNQTLGEVSSRTGFQPAYVIKGGRTELGDGGGVCQVSTTTFRAVLDAGLDVTKRLPHSYRVSYYELNQKPGIDATVYSGDIDFRFINDTDHYILIHNTADSDELYMKTEIYGTSDGRTSEITNHRVWDYRPPPAPQYYPDTSLPRGVTKQVDWAVSGVKASFVHTVRDRDGKIISEDEYYSNYRPWSAKFLVGQ